jgi:glycosyltransferase involved in cell wall biosynthesis/peptidoglycan/xylan/chitin deacetylase (PgdA/CDA1 family)
MKISVVIPTFNRRDILTRTLPAVLAQDFLPEECEVVVVVDGSTDGTVDVLQGFKPTVEFRILQQPRRGPAAARNAGLKAARGEWVLFLDDDILCGPELLKHHLAAHTGHDSLLVHGPIFVAPESPDSLIAESTRFWYEGYYGRVMAEKRLRLPAETYLISNSSARRALFLGSGGFDERIPSKEDSELGIRLWKMGIPFRYIPEAVTYEIFVKSSGDFLRRDVRMWGRAEVFICRKHPEYRGYSQLTGLGAGTPWKRFLRQVALRLPVSPERILTVPVRIAERCRRIPTIHSTGIRLLQVGHSVGLLRGALEEAGSWEKLRGEFGQRLSALLYHRIGPPQPGTHPALTVSPEQFESEVRWLARHGYVGIRPSDWLAWRREGKELPPKPILLTFDDAYADTAEFAFPILKRYGFSAGVFVVTSQVGGTNAWDVAKGSGMLRLMTAEQVRYWAAQGIEFGAHSRTHPDLTTLGERELADEVAGSGQDLSAILGTRAVSFAYPYGTCNEAVRRCAEASFDLAFTCEEGLNILGTDPHLLRRTNISPREGMTGFRLRTRLGWNPILRLRARLRLRSRAKALGRRLFERRG